MYKRITVIALLAAFVSVDANAQNRTHRRRGAIFGGLAGAALGAVIGDKGDNETAGALIGGAVGAIAGGTIGDQKDQRIEHNMRYHSGHPRHVQPRPGYQQGPYPQYGLPYRSPSLDSYPRTAPAVAPAVPTSRSVSTKEVIAMVRSGMSEAMIIKMIQHRGVDHELTVREVIELHELGVSEPIITEMQLVRPNIQKSEEVIGRPLQSYQLPPPPAEPYGNSVLGSGTKQ